MILEPISLTLAEINLLKKQSFTTESPITVLKDFGVMLEFVANGVDVSARSHLLPIKALPTINEKLSHSLTLKLKRPQQKSYPHINGLFLLLRASGLTQIVVTKKGAKLVLDASALNSWNSLNVTEQYFSLLESWLYRGHPEIIGERDGRWDYYCFITDIAYFFEQLTDGLNIKQRVDGYNSLKYRPGLANLALMQMFGWVEIELDASIDENWPIAKITATDWGRSLFKLYHQQLSNTDEDDTNTQSADTWSSELSFYFPDLKNCLVQPIDETLLETTIVFKVVLQNAWRKIQVSGSSLFDQLAMSILEAFDFDNDHLYEFEYKNRYGYFEHVVHPQVEHDAPVTTEWLVGSAPLYPGMALVFTFDFGDNWEFLLTVDSIENKPCNPKPKIIEKHGKPPKQYSHEW